MMLTPDNLASVFEAENEVGVDGVLRSVEKIAGFLPVELTNKPRDLNDLFKTEAERLRFLRDKGRIHAPVIDDENHRSALTLGHDSNAPLQHFAITEELILAVENLEEKLQRRLTETELELVAICCEKDAVNPHFSADAGNRVNALYYSIPQAFSTEGGLAAMFATNRIINASIGSYINEKISKETLKIYEICSGGRADKWQSILSQLQHKKEISLVLSDYVPPLLPVLNSSQNVRSLQAAQYSLLDEMPKVAEQEKVDVMLVTYGFDSVWMKQDARFLKEKGKWYRELNRVKILDSHPNKIRMLEALRSGVGWGEISLQDFGSILFESAMEEVDIATVPFGDQISDFYDDTSWLMINFPGGMLQKVKEAFENQLSQNGIFIIGDVTCRRKDGSARSYASNVSGIAARYKVEDYKLAKYILEKMGFKVEIKQLDQFANEQIRNWKQSATSAEIDEITDNESNIIMIVSRVV